MINAPVTSPDRVQRSSAHSAGAIDRSGGVIDVQPLAALLDRIEARWAPTQIWLFGSRARGDADDDSDWDLLVIVPDDVADDDIDDPLIGWHLQKGSGVYADVIACRAADFELARATPNTLAFEAATHGVLLYDR